MKPIKLITIKDLKVIRDLRAKSRGLTGEAQLAHNQKYALAIKAAYPIEKMNEVLDEVNGRATTHTYDSLAIRKLVIDAEDRLIASGVTVDARPGTRVTAISAVPESKAYARTARGAIATKVVLTRTTVAWVLTGAEKFERYAGPGGGEKVTTEITQAAKFDIVKKALDGYKVLEDKQQMASPNA